MRRREFLRLTGTGLLGLAVPASGCGRIAYTSRKPNIILIMADDMGYECLGCYGSTSYQTPVLDDLAATGIRFDHCYSQPLCTPSRVKIMTGRSNFRNYAAFGILDPDETTFAHVLQAKGYATCVAGKWQLYGSNQQPDRRGAGTYPTGAGFDDYCLWQITESESRYANPLLKEMRDRQHIYEGRYGPDVFTDYITDFMDRHRDQPFFVYYPMALVHSPFVPTPDSPEWETDRNQQDPRFFADMVAYTDKIVGRIRDKLEEIGQRENTVILFTGDNGTHRNITSQVNGRTIQGAKGRPTDAGTHVPLVANWPGTIPEGSVCDDLIDFSDFFPTLMEIARTRVPSELTIDGRSFLLQLKGEQGNPRDWIYCYYDPQWGQWEASEYVRDKRWKLYTSGEFYDLRTDAQEEHPIDSVDAGNTATAARQRLQSVLNSIR